MLSVRESQMPREKGYAIKAIRRMAPGIMRMIPRFLSRSKKSLREKDFTCGMVVGEELFPEWFKNTPLFLFYPFEKQRGWIPGNPSPLFS
jgi:hypothetical protein